MKVYVATRNAGKLREMETLFAGTRFELAAYAEYEDPVEGDVSYADNAALKARALHAQLRARGDRRRTCWRTIPGSRCSRSTGGRVC